MLTQCYTVLTTLDLQYILHYTAYGLGKRTTELLQYEVKINFLTSIHTSIYGRVPGLSIDLRYDTGAIWLHGHI